MSDEHLPEAQSSLDSDMGSILSNLEPVSSNVSALKRRASPSFEGLDDDTSRKRLKEEDVVNSMTVKSHDNILVTQDTLADNLAQELNCGCCSELCYRPVVVSPCQHFFCGRQVLLFKLTIQMYTDCFFQLLCTLDSRKSFNLATEEDAVHHLVGFYSWGMDLRYEHRSIFI